MAYGINVFNELGELVFDFNKSITIEEVGQTQTSVQLGMATLNFSNFWQYRGPTTEEVYQFSNSFGGTQNLLPHHIGTGTGVFLNANSFFERFPRPLVSRTSTYFYQVGTTGLLHHSEHVIDPEYWSTTNSEYGMFSLIVPANNTPLQYIRVDQGNFSGFSENYGLTVRDELGDIVFDSRANFLSLSEVLFVPKATMQNILENNATVDLSLRTPVPNCYISSPNHTSFLRPTNLNMRHVKISQPNQSTIRLTREAIGPNLNSVLLSVYNDTVIIVARDPFS